MTNGSKKKSVRGIGATASLEISTEIPSHASGRFVDAVTDIMRPFTEKRGLKADQIRLQREDVLIEIARKARARLEIEQKVPQPLPNKFLVPFLEKASLEEEGNLLIERWVDLLANCSIDPKLAHPRFVQILSELTAEDAQLLRSIAFNCIDKVKFPAASFEDVVIEYNPRYLRHDLERAIAGLQPDEIGKYVNKVYDTIIEIFKTPGVALLDISVASNLDKPDFWSLTMDEDIGTLLIGGQKDQDSLSILKSLSLVEEFYLELTNKLCDVNIYYVCLTALAVEFLGKCDNELKLQLQRKVS